MKSFLMQLKILLILFLLISFKDNTKRYEKSTTTGSKAKNAGAYLIILGTLQDGGSPHIGCKKKLL